MKHLSFDEFGPTYFVCKWPNGDVSIIQAESEKELFESLDCEGDPACATVARLKEGCHLILTPEKKGIKIKTCSESSAALPFWRKLSYGFGDWCEALLKAVK